MRVTHWFPWMMILLLAVGVPAREAPAQRIGGGWETLEVFSGASSSGSFGWTICSPGDLDGDGVPEIVIGASTEAAGSYLSAGVVSVFSGSTRALLYQISGGGDWNLGFSIARIADLDGDGITDLVIGGPIADPQGRLDAGSVFIHSGATGTLIRRIDGLVTSGFLGWAVAGTGDVDGDGFPDVAAGAARADGQFIQEGAAYMFSGATGMLLWSAHGANDYAYFGSSLAEVGDIDGDGIPDVAVGSTLDRSGDGTYDTYAINKVQHGAVYFYSGATGSLIRRLDGGTGGSQFGYSIAPAGDLDGDHVPDVLIGAPREAVPPALTSNYGAARLYSGASGRRLQAIYGDYQVQWFGQLVACPGDVDGNGLVDLLVGARDSDPGGVYDAGSAFLHEAATGNRIWESHGTTWTQRFGSAVSGVGDLDGDGLPEFCVGAYHEAKAYLYSFDPYLTVDRDVLSVSSGPPIELRIDFPSSQAGAHYLTLASSTGTGPTVLAGLTVPLTEDALFRRLRSGWAPPLLQNSHGVLDAAGDATATLTGSLVLAPFIGRQIYLACVCGDSGVPRGDLSSVAQVITIGP